MEIGLIGRKVGMTRVFNENGVSQPVSVIEVLENQVSQIKTLEIDGYNAIQLTSGKKKASKVTKPEAGHLAKAGVLAGDLVCEFRLENINDYELGKKLQVSDVFQLGEMVDVVGISKGKGFAGTVKRHNFRTQDMSHGNSRSHRVPGSIGQNQTPGKVFKGKKMSGHLGNVRCTVQSLELVRVDAERNLLLIKGAVPGAPGSKIIVKHAVK